MSRHADLLRQMVEGTLDARDFGHGDHVGVTFEALRRHPFFEALHIVADGIDAAARRAGAKDKFNATITLAFVCLIAERMDTAPRLSAQAFIDANPDLTAGAPLRALYSPERLGSARARRVALLPDRAGMPGHDPDLRQQDRSAI